MTANRSADAGTAPVHTQLPQPVKNRIFLYLGVLIVLMAFGSPHGGLIDIPLSFVLKNKLNLEAHELAQFRLIAAIPLYLSFVFGFLRDTWNPLGLGDRGFMLLFGAVSTVLYTTFAFIPLSSMALLAAIMLLTASFLFISSAQNGLASMLGSSMRCPARSARRGISSARCRQSPRC